MNTNELHTVNTKACFVSNVKYLDKTIKCLCFNKKIYGFFFNEKWTREYAESVLDTVNDLIPFDENTFNSLCFKNVSIDVIL